MPHQLVWIAILVVLVVGPLALASSALWPRKSTNEAHDDDAAPAIAAWPLIVNSAMAYALAFNLIFFIQELFLVLPKALTPGLRPTLFHNNHTWSGDNPLAALWQGTGVVAIIVTGLICLAILPALERRSAVVRLLVIWLAYHGLIMGLAQIPVGALSSGSDVGMAMSYLGWSEATKAALAVAALVAIALVAVRLTRCLLRLVAASAELREAALRQLVILKACTAAALLGTMLIIPFRVPRELVEVIGPPIVVAIVGILWMHAAAMHRALAAGVSSRRDSTASGSLGHLAWSLAIGLVGLFALFHFVLAPGVRFY